MSDPLTVELGPGQVAVVSQWHVVLQAAEILCVQHRVALARATLTLEAARLTFTTFGPGRQAASFALDWKLGSLSPHAWYEPMRAVVEQLVREAR